MFDAYDDWRRLVAAGMSMTQTSLRAFETVRAANDVVAVRTAIIGAAMRSPPTGNYAELGRMVPEKVEAFSRAGSVTAAAWWAAHSAWNAEMQYLGGMAIRGRPPTPSELVDLGNRTSALVLDSIEATAQLGSAFLAPVHRKATANARRLKRKGSRRARADRPS